MTPEEAADIIRKNWPPENYRMLREALEFQIEEIKRLEEETGDLLRLAHKQRAALKKLGGMVRARGEMLVEERAMVQLCHDPGKSEEYYHDAAKRQLRAEGVIG